MLKHELESLLASPFSKAGFTSLMREVLPGWGPAETSLQLNAAEHDLVVRAASLGDASEGSAGLDLDVLVVELASGHSVHAARAAQRAFLTRLLRQQQREAALAAFWCPDSDSWRLSFVRLTWQRGADGKVKTGVTAPLRRYSFVVGRDEPVHTATSQLLQLIQSNYAPNLEEIEQAFSIDRVTKEFYQRIAILFSELTGGQRKVGSKLVTFNPELHLPSVSDPEKLQRFAVRLIGRMLFAWFLTKKHAERGDPLMPPELLSVRAVRDAEAGKQSYYHDVLERVFFEVLNTPQEQRKPEYRGKPWSLVPFLSSNLFEARDDDYYKPNATGQSEHYKSLTVPNTWLHELLDLFSEYNFTIDENLSVDVDLAIEPEMLGRVFENLLAEINPETGETARKATGSYYTPRAVVDFMVDEALRSYLVSQTSLTDDQVAALLSYDGNGDTDLPEKSCNEVLDAFDRMTVLDPACGSGAFPMGILQKSLLVLSRVDPGSQRWTQRQLDHVADAGLREQLRDKLQREEREFVHKIGLVRNCIYGVDLQPIAVEMSKLRFLLSLMVDESIDDTSPNRGIMPLPNLEFKFACANSLIRSPGEHGGLMADAKDLYFHDLGSLTAQYFDIHDPHCKLELRKKIENLITDRVDRQLRLADRRNAQRRFGSGAPEREAGELVGQAQRDAVLWSSYNGIFRGDPVGFFEVPYFFPDVTDGFSIVIGNPPYIRQEDILDQKPALMQQKYEVWSPRSDLYVYFYERAQQLLAPDGVACYISSNKFMRAKYGENLRRLLSEQTTIDLILDLGGQKVFESATVDTCIVKFRRVHPAKDCIVLGVPMSSDFTLDISLCTYVHAYATPIPQQQLGLESWTIADDAVLCLKGKIAANGTLLRQLRVVMCRGILTGLNEAFVIDTPTKERLCSEDPRSIEVLKPVLRGRDINRFECKWAGYYLITTFKQYRSTLHLREYPAIMKHLTRYRDSLEPRPDQWNEGAQGTWHGRNTQPFDYFWYEVFFAPNLDEASRPKIMYPEFSSQPSFALETSGMYSLDTGWFLATDDLCLLGILNSSVAWWYLKQTVAQLGRAAFRMKKIYLDNLPIVQPDGASRARIEAIVRQLVTPSKATPIARRSKLESELNAEVYHVYGLTPDEIALIESGGSEKDS